VDLPANLKLRVNASEIVLSEALDVANVTVDLIGHDDPILNAGRVEAESPVCRCPRP